MEVRVDARLGSVGAAPVAALGELERYLVPVADRRVLRYVLDHLYVAHGTLERLLRAWASWSVRVRRDGVAPQWVFRRRWAVVPPVGDEPGEVRMGGPVGPGVAGHRRAVQPHEWAAALERLAALLRNERIMAAAGEARPAILRSVLLLDPGGDPERPVRVFVFPPTGHQPIAVWKLRSPGEAGGSLRREWAALREVRTRLDGELRGTIPEPLLHDVVDGTEVLLMAALPGRSVYVEVHNAFTPGRRAPVHFAAAASWLAAFHGALATGRRQAEPEMQPGEIAMLTESLREGGHQVVVEPRWGEELRADLARHPLPLSAAHGDFWPRNLLLGQAIAARGRGRHGGVAVVDWEDYASERPPTEDLFHFAVRYGVSYPWPSRGRTAGLEAFRRTFLDENEVSRAVRAYFRTYSDRAGVSLSTLDRLFCLYLLRRAAAVSGARPRRVSPPAEPPLWPAAYALFTRTERSVFSVGGNP